MKYKLGEKHKKRELYRVVYLRDIPRYGVKSGDVGGWIESERNLLHYGDCAVLDEAIFYDNAVISGNAKISDNARIFGNARIYGNAQIFGLSEICENAKIFANMQIDSGCHEVAPTLINRLKSNARLDTTNLNT